MQGAQRYNILYQYTFTISYANRYFNTKVQLSLLDRMSNDHLPTLAKTFNSTQWLFYGITLYGIIFNQIKNKYIFWGVDVFQMFTEIFFWKI